MAIFLSGVGGNSLLSNGLKVNVPELEHEGHSVVEPSGCITMIDESGIQLKNLAKEDNKSVLLKMRMMISLSKALLVVYNSQLTILTQQQNEKLDTHYHHSSYQTDHTGPLNLHLSEEGDIDCVRYTQYEIAQTHLSMICKKTYIRPSVSVFIVITQMMRMT